MGPGSQEGIEKETGGGEEKPIRKILIRSLNSWPRRALNKFFLSQGRICALSQGYPLRRGLSRDEVQDQRGRVALEEREGLSGRKR